MVEVKHPRIKRTSTIVILRSARPLANDKFTSSVQKSTHFATFYLFLSLSIAKSICSSIILYIYVPIYLSIYVSVNLSIANQSIYADLWAGIDLVNTFYSRFNRSDPGLATRETQFERDFLESIRLGKVESIQLLSRDSIRRLEMSKNWEFVKRCAKEAAHADNPEIVRSEINRFWMN